MPNELNRYNFELRRGFLLLDRIMYCRYQSRTSRPGCETYSLLHEEHVNKLGMVSLVVDG